MSFAITPQGRARVEVADHASAPSKEEFAAWMVTYVLYTRGVRTRKAFEQAAMATLIAPDQTAGTLAAANYLLNHVDACVLAAVERGWVEVVENKS